LKRLDSIQETLANIKIEWTTSDYFIMPDMALPEYPEGKDLHFGYYVLFICVAGNMELFINDVPTTIDPFCLYAFNPGTIVKPKSKSDDCVLRILLFTKDFLLKNNFKTNALDDFKFFADSKYNKINLNQEEVSSLLQLYDLLHVKKDNNQSVYYLEIIRSLFYTFLYEAQAIYSKDFTNTESISKRERDLNNKFNELIKAQAITQHNLKFYADALFITPKYLISAIKNASGKTPGVLINETIIEEAKQYLVHTDLPVVQIADRLQFTDIATFSKFFKRYTALSPSAFRKKFQQ
jgi:AraC family 4-hydroxyphenylacetate 3-monooxygenase operon regulatory protein